MLWRNDGRVTNWLGQANGGFVGNAANAYHNADTAGMSPATGDFNGDGRDDVLWRNDNGTVTDWLGQADGGFRRQRRYCPGTMSRTRWHVQPFDYLLSAGQGRLP